MKVPDHFARSELVNSLISIAWQFVLNSAQDVLNAKVTT